jgi:hypothetical protein
MARVKDNIAWLDEQRVARGLPPAKRRLALFGKGVVPGIGKLADLPHGGDRQPDQRANSPTEETDPRRDGDVHPEG